MQKEIAYTIYQVNHYHFIKTIHISILHRDPKSGTQSPIKAENEVYTGVPMGYGTIASNGASHGKKAQTNKRFT